MANDNLTCEGCGHTIMDGQPHSQDPVSGICLCEPCTPQLGDMLMEPTSFVDADGVHLTPATAAAFVARQKAKGETLASRKAFMIK